MIRSGAAWFLLPLFLGGSVIIVREHDARVPADPVRGELMYFPSAPAVRAASLGHASTAADVAWLRAIQYYGFHKRTDRKYEKMGHIFEIITELDPFFVNAYIFGGLVTAQDGRDVERGLRLMEKGMARNPESWRLAFETGFVLYTCAMDYAAAARHFRRAAELPGAPETAMRFAAHVAGRAGDPRASLYLWKVLAGTTTNPVMVERAREEIGKLEAVVAGGAR